MMEENGLPKGWVETTLGEVVVLCSTKIPTTKINLNNYISTENMLSDKGGVTISNALPNTLNVNHYKINDTLFSNIRTYFKKVWHADREGGASNDVLIFRPKNNKIFDHKFLYYHISSDNFIDFTVKTARGTKMPRGDKNAIINLKIFIPQEISEQKAIASILTSFDDKIELLQAQNETLETIAQTIFKEWFGKYQVGDELPEGWRVGKLESFFDFLEGPGIRNWQYTENGNRFINIRLIQNGDINVKNANCVSSKEANSKYSHFQLKEKDFVLSTSGTLGRGAIVRKEHLPLLLNTSVIRFRPKDGFSYGYTYQFLQSSYFLHELESLASGSVQLNFGPMHLRQIVMVLPNEQKLEEFSKKVNPLYDKIIQNYSQIQTLQATRDTLLPKLMSGQLRVAEFQEQLSEVM